MVPHWKALRYGKYEPRGISCESAVYIRQDVSKSANLLHEYGFCRFSNGRDCKKTENTFYL